MIHQGMSAARLQQCITAAAGLAAVLCGLALIIAEPSAKWLAGILLCVILFSHAAILATEFVLLCATRAGDPAPAGRASQLIGAWWAEVRCAPAVFCWRQPFFSNRWPDHLPANAQTRGLLLVHGLLCNRGFWNPRLKCLTALQIPFVAVDLHPVFGSIDSHVAQIEQAVQQLERSTGMRPVVIAHSMGGLVVRKWWATQVPVDARGRVHHVVTLATPHYGTWLARFGSSTNARQMRQGSDWLLELAASEPPERAQYFTCYYSNCDNIVFPPSTASFEGAANHHLRGFAHVHIGSADAPWKEVLRLLAT